jgi:zinc/manganese transport system ATP-binding protein
MRSRKHLVTNNKPVVELRQASLELGGRALWNDLSMSIQTGEFIAVLGPNGAGKTSLLQILLGLMLLGQGTALINGEVPRKGNESIGYIPQQRSFDKSLPIRGRDLVQLGVNGQKYGFGRLKPTLRAKVDKAIADVSATGYADKPIGLLSGGEQQRLRIAQALVSQPKLLLCDEPLLSLDIASQKSITKLIHDYKEAHNAAVLFVTHEINPILPWVDRILYLAAGRWVVDTPEIVLQSKTLSKLYGTPIDVLKVRGRVLVVGADDAEAGAHHHMGHMGGDHS